MRLRFFYVAVLCASLSLALSGCELPPLNLFTTNDIDPAGGLGREDYLALRHREPEAKDQEEKTAPPIPDMPAAPVAAPQPLPPATPMDRLVSVTITDSVPVRDVLMELVRKTDANLELDPRVSGTVIISARNQPFGQVLKRICGLAGLRYSTDGAFIHIEPDDPYQKSYQLDYLSLSRKTSSETALATNVFDVDVGGNGTSSSSSGSNGGSAAATQNNSTAKVSGVSEADFWPEAEKSIAQILASNERKPGAKVNFSIDKQAGIVTVYGDQRQQQAIETYFNELRRKSTSQVLIDARIVEVELDDTYQAGIDWQAALANHHVGLSDVFAPQSYGTTNFFTGGVSGSNFNLILNLVQTFGTTRVLSAPRVTVMNNQTAVMKVATNQVYFVTQAQFTTTTNANGSSVTTNPVYTSTPRTVPVGLVMTVQPSIDSAKNSVTMTLRPTISRIVGQVDDPSINLNAAVAGVSSTVQSQIPVLAVREMDSVLQLHSGEIAIMGGLMQDSSINQDQGIPVLSDIPYVGSLFKSRNNQGKTTELVILLRATIAEQPKPDDADANLYHAFSNDPRPLGLPNKLEANPKPLPELPFDERGLDPTL